MNELEGIAREAANLLLALSKSTWHGYNPEIMSRGAIVEQAHNGPVVSRISHTPDGKFTIYVEYDGKKCKWTLEERDQSTIDMPVE